VIKDLHACITVMRQRDSECVRKSVTVFSKHRSAVLRVVSTLRLPVQVYLILLVQLLVTVGVICLFIFWFVVCSL